MGWSITAIDYSLLLTLKSMFRDGKYGREHNKHDFDADYNNFVLMQDKLTILANYEQAHGGRGTAKFEPARKETRFVCTR